jgi:6-pyruvoyltetrahydropterin/6-carboxytetrahydropterin synthase
MHKLTRQVRFSINPFLPEDSPGFNSFASNPVGEGLSVFFELCAEVTGDIDPATGFVVNVLDIDKNVRQHVVPVFAERIRENFKQGRHMGFSEMAELLKSSWGRLSDKFAPGRLSGLSLAMNPFRKLTVDREDCKMIYFSEKFEFAATHKLWNDDFSNEKNFEVFGKCANPSGHGHNYIVEVTIKISPENAGFKIGEFERTVDSELIKLLDHKNLNVDVTHFARVNPTVENLAVFAWEKLADKFGRETLHCITVWETDKTYCSYYGRQGD